MTKILGYTDGGRRTAKWEAAVGGDHNSLRALVEVPTEIVEGGRSCAPARSQEGHDAQIMVR